MIENTKLIDCLKGIEIFKELKHDNLIKISEFFSIENFSMGEPIILGDKLPNDFYFIFDGEVRQLIESPILKKTISLATYKKGYLVGWPSYLSGIPLELMTAATDCTLLKISKKNWLKVNDEFSILKIENQAISASLVWPILKNEKKITFPKKVKDFRNLINKYCSKSKLTTIYKINEIDKKLKNDKNWFFGKKAQNYSYGELVDLEKIKLFENDQFPLNLIGIPLNFSEVNDSEIDSKIIRKKVIKDNLTVKEKKDENLEFPKIEEEINPKKENLSKFSFYGSSDDFISEAISCFRIIGDTLNLPIKYDLIRRSFVENTKDEKSPISLQLCAAIAESLGLKTQLYDIPIGLVKRLNLPALVKLKDEELAVLHSFKNDQYLLARPKDGLKEYSTENLLELLSGNEIVPILSLQATDRTPKKRLSFKWFLPAIKKNKKPLIEVFIASFFVQLFQLMNPLIIQQIIDKVIGQGASSSLLPLVVLLFSFSFFENMLTALRTNLFIDTTNRIDMSLGEQVIDHLLRLPLPYFDKRNVGELSSRVGELEQIRSFLTGTALTVVLDSVFSIIYIAVMLLYSWVLTIVALLVAPLLALITLLVAPVIRSQLRTKAELNAKTQNHLVEVLTGIQTVKAQNFELKARWKWKERYSKYISESFRNAVTSTSSNGITNFLNQASSLSVLCVGSFLVINGNLTLGQLIAFRIISGYVTTPLLRLSNVYQNFQQTNISLERLSDIIDTPQESTDTDKNNIPMPYIKGDISIEDISFRFNEKGALNLSNVNLSIDSGQFVAIVGQSGSGKSTLTKLLSRLYEPLQGKISIDNVDISKVELYSLRRQIGIVPQDSILFDGTVQDNIALTNPEASVEEIVNAATIASAHDFIMELPSGYATKVGERGSNLSGGQRQRIAIARSILQNPNILIMDESTSALDFETERKVSLNLMEYFRGKTVLFITHRLNSIVHADKIVLMHEGRLEEQGTHLDLMSLEGRYYSLYRQQGKYSS
tara:strand:- start:5051 stop:8041 length:2991 start_codon:yes stop_codon:yes gene_type:complete